LVGTRGNVEQHWWRNQYITRGWNCLTN
jgi:hypothetical protein